MKLTLKLLMLLFFSRSFGQGNAKLFPAKTENLWGYIDVQGTTSIKAQFLSAGEFSESLAAVRLNGTYGYINESGTFVITPQYDLALAFENGLAQVFKDGKPLFIDKTGNIAFQHSFKRISPFKKNSYAIVFTSTEKYGLIDKQGKLIVDTVFKYMKPFVGGVSVVQGFEHMPYRTDSLTRVKYEVGVIDSSGKWIIPYGRYKEIQTFQNGYAVAELIPTTEKEEGWTDHEALIDTKGNQRFIFPAKKYRFDFGNSGFYNGVAKVNIYSVNVDTVRTWSSWIRTDYAGVINPDGKILFSDTSWRKCTPFACNRAFVLDGSGKWKMINKSGKQASDSTFRKILFDSYDGDPKELFTDGTAWVKVSQGWTAIDTNGKFLSKPKEFTGIYESDMHRVGHILFFKGDISTGSSDNDYAYGFWNSITNAYIAPTYHDIDQWGFDKALIEVLQDGKTSYINPSGKLVWTEKPYRSSTPATLNIDYMNRGYFYAYSEPHKGDLGGFGSSNNFAKKIPKSYAFKQDSVSVNVLPEFETTPEENYLSSKVYVANTTGKQILFNASDSRLYMKVQALDSKGEWRDIEYLPGSWCGNSYHTLSLKSGYFWSFLTPVYSGEFKTKLRVELKYIDPKHRGKDETKEITIYSNTYEGSINPGQFWYKRNYYTNGLMDPYSD